MVAYETRPFLSEKKTLVTNRLIYSKYCPSNLVHLLINNRSLPAKKREFEFFGGNPIIQPFFYSFIGEVLCRKRLIASTEMIIGGSDVWGIWRGCGRISSFTFSNLTNENGLKWIEIFFSPNAYFK